MPLINWGQLIDKTFVTAIPTPVYRTSDIINKGDKAKPATTVKKGYSFILDSFLSPVEENRKYGFLTAKRSDYYLLFKGNDGKPYAIKYNPNAQQFDSKILREQGVKTIQEQIKEAEDREKNPLTRFWDSLGKTGKTAIFIGLGIFALGYLIPKLKK